MSVDVAGILLAAGFSRRFGSAKLMQLLPTENKPIALVSAKNLFEAIPDSVVVTRTDDHELIVLCEQNSMPTVSNPLAKNGLSSSIQRGISYFPTAKSWVFALADMPFIDVDVIMGVARALQNQAPLVAPVYNGIRGHPVGFSANFKGELFQLTGDHGAKAIIEKNITQLLPLAVSCSGVLQDIDAPEQIPRK